MSDRSKWSPGRPEYWNRFHELWTWAVDKPGYNKKDWMDLETEIEKLRPNEYVSAAWSLQSTRENNS